MRSGSPVVACAAALASACALGQADGGLVHTWTLAPVERVDLLLVVDDSNSMEAEQFALADALDALAAPLEVAQVDARVGVITVGWESEPRTGGALLGDPPLLGLGSAGDDLELLRARVRVGLQGSGKERGLAAAAWAVDPSMLAAGAPNEGLRRPDASLRVLWVSDEDDCSDAGRLGPDAENTDCYARREILPPPQSFADLLVEAAPAPADTRAAAVVGRRSSDCFDVIPGTRYEEAVARIGGHLGDVCGGPSVWTDVLGRLGDEAVGRRSSFTLAAVPADGSIRVALDDVDLVESADIGWTFDAALNAVVLHGDARPAVGSTVGVAYDPEPVP